MPSKPSHNLPYELFMLLVCLMAPGVLVVDAGEARIWKTPDGIYKTEAEFVEISEDGKTVTLRRKRGTEFQCAIETFSKEDQKYIQSQSELKESNPTAEDVLLEAKIPPEDAAKEGEFGVDVWGDVVEETARAEYQKQKDDYALYQKFQKNITAKKEEIEAERKRYARLSYSSGKARFNSSEKQRELESELRELEYNHPRYEQEDSRPRDGREYSSPRYGQEYSSPKDRVSYWEYSSPRDRRIGKQPQEPDASLLQKKVKKIIGTVRAELVSYTNDGMVTYRIKEAEKKTHIREMTSGDLDRIIAERLKKPIDKKFFQSDVIKKQVELFIGGADSEGFKEEWKKLKWTPQEINRIVVFLLLYQLETQRKYELTSPCFKGTLYELLKEKTSAVRAADCPKDVFALMACAQKAFLLEAERAGKMNLAKITELNNEAKTLEKTNKNDPQILLLRDQAKTLQVEDAGAAIHYRNNSEEIDKWKPLFSHWSGHRYDGAAQDAKPAKSYDNKNRESELKDLF